MKKTIPTDMHTKVTIPTKIHVAYLLILILSMTNCKKEAVMLPSPIISEMTVLVYIAANNNLQTEALNSIKKMQRGFVPIAGRVLLVFAKTSAESSYLLKINHSEDNRIVSDTLKIYKNKNSSDPDFLKSVIADSRKLYPAKTYGLVLWSHATSWTPPVKGIISTKSFGYDDDIEMDIKDLNNVLPDDFEYLMFDACSMASTEVCFELRNKARYIIASPAEILSTSFPYDQISNDLFEGLEGLKRVAQKFIDFYNSQSGLYASATISIIETKLMDSIAYQANSLLSAKLPLKPINRIKIQSLDFEKGSGVEAYDFISFLRNNYQEDEYLQLKGKIEKAVLYKGMTANFLGIVIKEYCGLSIYIPEPDDPYFTYYSTLKWSGQSAWNKIFF